MSLAQHWTCSAVVKKSGWRAGGPFTPRRVLLPLSPRACASRCETGQDVDADGAACSHAACDAATPFCMIKAGQAASAGGSPGTPEQAAVRGRRF